MSYGTPEWNAEQVRLAQQYPTNQSESPLFGKQSSQQTQPNSSPPNVDINNWYRGVLGRDADAGGLASWQAAMDGGMSADDAFKQFKATAAGNGENVNGGFGMQDSYSAPAGTMTGGDGSTVTDEWAANNGITMSQQQAEQLRQQYAQVSATGSVSGSKDLYNQFLQQNGGGKGLDYGTASRFGAAQPQAPAPAASPFGNPFAYNQKNPYLDDMSATIRGEVNDNLSRNIMPQIRSSAVSTGNFGGSRQGVVEANAFNDANKQISNSLTGMRFGDYNNTMQRQLQKYGMDQGYDLGLRNNDLGFGQLDFNINQGNFNNNMQAANFGLGVQNYLNQNNQAGIAAGTNIQNTQLDYQKYLNSAGVASGGAGGTSTGTTRT